MSVFSEKSRCAIDVLNSILYLSSGEGTEEFQEIQIIHKPLTKDIYKIRKLPTLGWIAQLVERWHVNPEVSGSNPVGSNFSLGQSNLFTNL